MEHNVYEKVQEYLALLSKIELLTCTVVHNSFKKVRDQAQQVSTSKDSVGKKRRRFEISFFFFGLLKKL